MKNFMNAKTLLLGAACALNFSLPAMDFNVHDFGAAGDGVTLDTAAIQRTIDAAAKAGNGARVVIPRGGRFVVATLVLKSGIDFHLEGDLLISTNQADYATDGVITALNARDLSITGKGNIRGRSLSFMTGYDAADEWWLFKEWRPKMFVLTGCTNLIVRDITFSDAPFWGLHMLGCKKVLVEHVTVDNRLHDGVNPGPLVMPGLDGNRLVDERTIPVADLAPESPQGETVLAVNDDCRPHPDLFDVVQVRIQGTGGTCLGAGDIRAEVAGNIPRDYTGSTDAGSCFHPGHLD